MNAREIVLQRIHDALELAPSEPVTVPRDYRVGRQASADDRLTLLVDRLEEYGADVRRCTGPEVPRAVADALADSDARYVVVPAGLDPAWLSQFHGDVHHDATTDPPAAWTRSMAWSPAVRSSRPRRARSSSMRVRTRADAP